MRTETSAHTRDPAARARPSARRIAPLLCSALTSLLFSVTGCQATMPNQSPASLGGGTIVPNEFPIRFKGHQFEPHCYNTYGCTVVYNRRYQHRDEPDQLSPPPGEDYMDTWGTMEIGIDNFPPPAEVEWRSLDGTAHATKVDLDRIFNDRVILHDVPESDIPDGWAHDLTPEIHLVVNDRNISVYMRTHIAMKELQDPTNRLSDFRTETVKAWSQDF